MERHDATHTTSMSECPCCGLALSTRAALLPPRHCPRCLVRRRRLVELRPGTACRDRIRRAPRAQAEELEPIVQERLYGERDRVARVA
jgi:hypothetical protein